jgi:hypothetical protein
MAVISIRVSDEWLSAVGREMKVRQWSRNAAVVNLVWRALLGDKGEVAQVANVSSNRPLLAVGEIREKTTSEAKPSGYHPERVPTSALGARIATWQNKPSTMCVECGSLNGMHQKWCKK